MQFLPDLRFSTTGSKNYGRNFDQTEGRIVDRVTNSASLGRQFGRDAVRRLRQHRDAARGASSATRRASRICTRARETVVFTVASKFLALIQQQEQLRVQRENLAAASALEQQIQTYVDAGARTIADLYQQQANAASARFAVVDAERAAELAKVDLIETLQLDPTRHL